MEKSEKKTTIIKRGEIHIMKHPETYHDLSKGYKFDEISMNKMADNARRNTEKWEILRKEEDRKNLYIQGYSLKEIIRLLKELLE